MNTQNLNTSNNPSKLFSIFITILLLISDLSNSKLINLPTFQKQPLTQIQKSQKVEKVLSKVLGTEKFHFASITKLALSRDPDDIAIMVTLLIGPNKVPLEFMLDTGSTWTWINLSDCKIKGMEPVCKKFGKAENFYYYDGRIRGRITHTSIWLTPEIESKNHTIMVVHRKTEETMKLRVLGLSISERSQEGSILETLAENDIIPEKSFMYHKNNKTVKKIL